MVHSRKQKCNRGKARKSKGVPLMQDMHLSADLHDLLFCFALILHTPLWSSGIQRNLVHRSLSSGICAETATTTLQGKQPKP